MKYIGKRDLKTVDSKGKRIVVRNVPHYKMRNGHIIVEPIDVCYADLLQHAEEMVFSLQELQKIRIREEELKEESRNKSKEDAE